MNDDPSTTPNDDELLSAYIDDALSDAERADVEARIASDPDARRLLDQLQALSATLRAAPRESLDGSLRDAVLRAIDRKNDSTDERPAPLEQSPWWRRQSRGLAWSVLAIAAALLVMVFSGEWPGREREIAQQEKRIAGADRELVREDARPAAPLEKARRAPGAASTEELNEPERAEGGAAAGATRDGAAPADDMEDAMTPSDDVMLRPAPTTAASTLDADESGQAGDARAGAVAGAADPSDAFFNAVANEAVQRFVDEGADEPASRQLVQDLERIAPEREPVVVVQVDLSSRAVQSQSLAQTFARNTIEFKESLEEIEQEFAKQLQRGGARVVRSRGATPEPTGEAENAVEELYNRNDARPEDEFVAIAVDATPVQLRATLDELQADLANVVQLQIESNAAAPEARGEWDQYGRGATSEGAVPADTKARLGAALEVERSQGQSDEHRALDESIENRPAKENAPSPESEGDRAGDRVRGETATVDAPSKPERAELGDKKDVFAAKETQAQSGESLGRAWRVPLQRDVGFAYDPSSRAGRGRGGREFGGGGFGGAVEDRAGDVEQKRKRPSSGPGQRGGEADKIAEAPRVRALFLVRVVPTEPPPASDAAPTEPPSESP